MFLKYNKETKEIWVSYVRYILRIYFQRLNGIDKLQKFYSKMTIRQETKTTKHKKLKKLRVPGYTFFPPSLHLSHRAYKQFFSPVLLD